MLVLTRKRFQQIRIGSDIVIKVIKTGRGAVKIGIDAPADVRVMRAELCDARQSSPQADEVDFVDLSETQAMKVCSDPLPHTVSRNHQ